MIRLRAHHLLCIALFVGEGYSPSFTNYMKNLIKVLNQNPKTEVFLIQKNDLICSSCPNEFIDSKSGKHACSLNSEDVRVRDERVLSCLELEQEREYPYDFILKRMKERITEEKFYLICGTCRWHKKGLCMYDKLVKSLTENPIIHNGFE